MYYAKGQNSSDCIDCFWIAGLRQFSVDFSRSALRSEKRVCSGERLRHCPPGGNLRNSKPTPWEQLMEQLQLLFQYIFYLNFAINFFLYSLFSVKFREALCRLAWQMKYKWQSFKEWSYRVLARNSSDSSLAVPDVGPASPRIVAVDELEFAKMITPKRST